MRRTRVLVVVAILAIIGAVASSYLAQRDRLRRDAPRQPVPLPLGVSADLDNWSYAKTVGGNTKVEIEAKAIKQIKEPSVVQLEQAQIRIYDERKKQYDLVRSALATFDTSAGHLFSEGKVDIDMGINENGEHVGRLLSIHTSGVTFDSNTGKASTDRYASFEFDQGDGHADGASYDPQSRELRMHNNAYVNWQGDEESGKPPMVIESGKANYHEGDRVVLLGPWAKLTRGGAVIESGPATVRLNDAGGIDVVEAVNAKGTDHEKGRDLKYNADEVAVNFDADGRVTKVGARKNASIESVSPTARTHVTSDVIDMDFSTLTGESLLEKATGNGNTRLESRPIPQPGKEMGDTRILRSEVVEMVMRKDGESMDLVRTHTPGQLDLVPNVPGRKKRHLDAERISMEYGEKNQMKRFLAVNAKTRTDSPAPPRGQKPTPPAFTSSKGLIALFDQNTGEMTQLQQWDNFRYQQGDRQASADGATIDYQKDLMTLANHARVWDDTGSTFADHIDIRQSNGDAIAVGHVNSTRLPERQAKGSAGMVSNGDPMRARAERMIVTNSNTRIRYEGNADVWSGANRIQAPLVEIDRTAGTLRAEGGVTSRLVQNGQQQDSNGKPAAKSNAPRASDVTIVKARTLAYSDTEKLAHYSGDAVLTKDDLEVRARDIYAWFRDDNAKSPAGGAQQASNSQQSSVDRIFAEGNARVVKKTPQRTRTGTAEHAEYYLGNERLVLKGGNPMVNDSERGSTRGNVIVWYARDDKLLVDNSGSGPAVSRIRQRSSQQ